MDLARLLIVDADAVAFDRLVTTLTEGGLNIAAERADTPIGIEVALRWFEPQVVLLTAGLPGVDSLRALDLVQEVCPHARLVFVMNAPRDEPPREVSVRAAGCVLRSDQRRLHEAVRDAAHESHTRRSLRRAEPALKDSEVRFRLFMDNLPGAAYIKDLDGRFTYLNEACGRLLGRSAQQVIGRRLGEILPAGVAAASIESDQRALEIRQPVEAIEEVSTLEGPRTLLSVKFPLLNATGETTMIGGISMDMTKRVLEERRLARLGRLHSMLGAINAAVVRAPSRDALFRAVCHAAVEAGGFRMAWVGLADLGHTKVDPVASYGHEAGYLDEVGRALAVTTEERQLTGWSVEFMQWDSGLAAEAVRRGQVILSEDIAQDPRVVFRQAALDRGYRSLVALPLTLQNETIGMVMLFADAPSAYDQDELLLLTTMGSDISFGLEYLHATQRLVSTGWYDLLTGLANRQLFIDRLSQMLADDKTAQRGVHVLLFDLRRFHEINKRVGRSGADHVLEAFASRLTAVFGRVGTVSRIGGDRFAVAVRELRPSLLATLGTERWDGTLTAAVSFDGVAVPTPFKLGIATAPADGDKAEQLLLNAEAALRVAKESGESYAHHSPELSALASHRLQLEARLRLAVEREDFVLHYLPKVDLRTRALVGVEALIRWRDGDRLLLPAADFVPILEDIGLGEVVGRWVMQRAITDIREWQARGLEAPRVSINVSLAQVAEPDFVGKVLAAMGGPRDGAAGLDLEITETHLMTDVAATTEKLRQLRDMGIGIAMDDFGTGLSSLSQLVHLPVDSVKIDRSLILDLDLDGAGGRMAAIVAAIIGMTKALGLVALAEGVESEATARLLLELGCDQGQGYLFGLPQPADDVVALLGPKAD